MQSEIDGAETDVPHTSGEHIDWNESYYFNVYDARKDVCGFMRIGLKPNKREKSMFCFFIMPDGSVVGARGEEELRDSDFSAIGLSLERVIPDKEWRLSFKGTVKRTLGSEIKRVDASFDLTYLSINRTFDYRESYSGDSDLLSQAEAAEHTEQFGRVRGTLTIGGETIDIDGLGERDHSWGVKDWLSPTIWIWLSGQFSDKHAFNATKLIMGNNVVDAGYVYIDGVNRPIVRIDANTVYSKTGGPVSFKMWLMEKGGEVHEIDGEVVRTAMMPFSGAIDKNVSTLYETLARYKSREKIGFGIAEYLVRRHP